MTKAKPASSTSAHPGDDLRFIIAQGGDGQVILIFGRPARGVATALALSAGRGARVMAGAQLPALGLLLGFQQVDQGNIIDAGARHL